METLLIGFVTLTFLDVVLPFLILGGAFWIVRRCAWRWQTVFWQAGVYGTGAGPSQGAAARIWKLKGDCEAYSPQYPNLQSRKCSPVDGRSGRFALPNTASIQPRNSRNSSRSRAGSAGRRRA